MSTSRQHNLKHNKIGAFVFKPIEPIKCKMSFFEYVNFARQNQYRTKVFMTMERFFFQAYLVLHLSKYSTIETLTHYSRSQMTQKQTEEKI